MCFQGPLGYGQDNLDFKYQQGQEISPELPDQLWSPPGFLSSRYEELFPHQRCEVDHSPLSIAKVRTGGTIPIVPICAFKSCVGTILAFTRACYWSAF